MYRSAELRVDGIEFRSAEETEKDEQGMLLQTVDFASSAAKAAPTYALPTFANT